MGYRVNKHWFINIGHFPKQSRMSINVMIRGRDKRRFINMLLNLIERMVYL